MKKFLLALLGLIILLAIFVSLAGFKQIDAGHRGIKKIWGKVVPESLHEGLYIYNPISTEIIALDVRTKKKTARLEAYTKDIQQTTMRLAVNYNIKPNEAHTLYITVGNEYERTLIEPAILGAAKDVVGKVEAVNLVNNREKATQEIETRLKSELEKSNIIISNVAIEDIEFSSAFENAIEAKEIATQEANKSRNETNRIAEEAKQRVIKAQAEADAKKASSDATAYAISVESKAKADAVRQLGIAEADAIKEKSKALSENNKLVELTKAERWNGSLPQNIYAGAPIPFLDLNK